MAKLLLILVTSVALVTVTGVVTGVYIRKEKQPPGALTTTATRATILTTMDITLATTTQISSSSLPFSQLGTLRTMKSGQVCANKLPKIITAEI